ncbi:MAG: bb3-type cytochrome oxidase subunit [Bryobacterales bacterium]|nr:bb3-type cytochrome oxidase subunit [Bryobacterales bacterium]
MNARELLRGVVRTRRQRAMFLCLCADGVVFLALFTAYIYLRVHSTEWPVALHFASGLMAFAMTLFTVCGSFTMAVAAREQRKGNEVIAVRLILATIALFGTFLLLDAMEWARLLLFERVSISTAFGSTFFALSGYHALHVLVALFYMAAVAGRIKRSDVGACALFVHFTNLVWLALFVGLYLSNADLKGL